MTTPTRADLTGHRRLARELEEWLTDAAIRDRVAYAALMQDGEQQPWTEAAQRLWEDGGGQWRTHHLAVAHHSRAYDLEAAGDDAAFGHWREALRHWAALHRHDAFWDMMREHLEEVTGAGLPAGLLQEVRDGLPGDLLAPHLTRVAQLAGSDPARARRHVEVMVGSGLPSEAVEQARDRLAHEVVEKVSLAVAEARYAEMIAELERWLGIDPTNRHLVRALLFTSRMWFERESRSSGWPDRIAPTLAKVQGMVAAFRTGNTSVVLAAGPSLTAAQVQHIRASGLGPEIARLEFWAGLQSREATTPGSLGEVALAASRRAIGHFQAALRIDPELPISGEYRDVEKVLAETFVLAVLALLKENPADSGVAGAGLPAHIHQVLGTVKQKSADMEMRGYLADAVGLGTNVLEAMPADFHLVLVTGYLRLANPLLDELRTARSLLTRLLNRPGSSRDRDLMQAYRGLDEALRMRGG